MPLFEPYWRLPRHLASTRGGGLGYIYGSGLKDVKIVYRAGRLNCAADALSQSPCEEASTEGVAEQELQVASVQSQPTQSELEDVSGLLESPPLTPPTGDFSVEQRKDPSLKTIIDFHEQGTLPEEEQVARRVILQKLVFTLEAGILYYLDPRQGHQKRAVVPQQC